MLNTPDSLSEPVLSHIRRDFVSVRPEWTVMQCLENLRGAQEAGGIFYIYVTDSLGTLLGVIPIRKMLAVEPSTCVGEIMIKRLVILPDSASVYDACEIFILHKFLAIPIVDAEKRLVGIADVNLFTDEMLDLGQRPRVDEVFQWIGVHMDVLSKASPFQAFRYRFPWLTATMASGILCAVLAGFFEQTLERAAILAMFLTVALGLGESVSIQSMSVTMQALQGQTSLKSFIRTQVPRELLSALLLALACGTVIGGVTIFWPGTAILSLSIGISIMIAIVNASLAGVAVPSVLHKLKLDPKVAAGPITLALADLSTIFVYLSAATFALKLGSE